MSSAEWITDRLPTAADGDTGGFVRMKRKPSSRETDWTPVHWSHVGAAAPWQHTNFWESPIDSDRIAALEQRLAERDRAQSVLTAALANRLSALEGVVPDGTVPAKVPGGIAALEQRVAELEAFKRELTTIPAREFA